MYSYKKQLKKISFLSSIFLICSTEAPAALTSIPSNCINKCLKQKSQATCEAHPFCVWSFSIDHHRILLQPGGSCQKGYVKEQTKSGFSCYKTSCTPKEDCYTCNQSPNSSPLCAAS